MTETDTERRQQQQQETDNTISYSKTTTKNNISCGKLTLTAKTHDIQNFTIEQLYHDLPTKQPSSWKHVLGVQPIQRSILEIQIDNEQAMTHTQLHGLDTQHTPQLSTGPTTCDDVVI